MSPRFLIVEMEKFVSEVNTDGVVDEGPVQLGMVFRRAIRGVKQGSKECEFIDYDPCPREIELRVVHILYFGHNVEELDFCGRLVLCGLGIDLLQKWDSLIT